MGNGNGAGMRLRIWGHVEQYSGGTSVIWTLLGQIKCSEYISMIIKYTNVPFETDENVGQ